MDSMYFIQIVYFVLISTVCCYTGSRENTLSDGETYSLRINLQHELNFIKEQIISETKIRMNLDRDVSRMSSLLRVLSGETQSMKNEHDLLKKQIEQSLKDNIQLKKKINDTEEDNVQLKKQINEIREDNVQLKVNITDVLIRWHEDIAKALNVSMARTERFNATIASIRNDDRIHNLTEIISQYRNYSSDKLDQSDFNNELLRNFTILEGQLRVLKIRLNEQTTHQENLSRTIDEQLKTIAANFKEYDATMLQCGETQSMKNEHDLLKKQIEQSLKDNIQLKKKINDTEEDNVQLKKQINEIREDNVQLKVNITDVLIRWHEDIAKALNVSMARTERFNATIASIRNDDRIHNLTEIISQYRNYASDKLDQSDFNNELLGNFTILEGQLRVLKIRLNEQTTHQENLSRTIDEQLKTIAANFKEYDATMSSLEKTVEEVGQYKFQDCQALLEANMTLKDGVYNIYPAAFKPETSVFCDMSNGGWTVSNFDLKYKESRLDHKGYFVKVSIDELAKETSMYQKLRKLTRKPLVFQRRKDGKTDFYRGWNEYRNGFGNPENEYWLGNKYLHILTTERKCVLKIDMVNWDNIASYAEYNDFSVESEDEGFTLRIGNYAGNAGHDSLAYHNGTKFTTKDVDQDRRSYSNCAVDYTGAWWYYDCVYSNLNGDYSQRDSDGVFWYSYPLSGYMKYTAMKLQCW